MVNAHGATLDLEVVPNSKEFCIAGFNPWTGALRVKVKAIARKGLANTEVAQELEKFFGKKVEIISGKKSRKKRILVSGFSQPQINQIVRKAKP